MQTTFMAAGPQFANGGEPLASSNQDIRVVDLFALLCNLLEVEQPPSSTASSEINRVKSLLRYPSDTQVVKVIRNWMDFALMPENVPITSKAYSRMGAFKNYVDENRKGGCEMPTLLDKYC